MKRVSIISLVLIFLTCQFSYATCPYGNCIKNIKDVHELTQADIEEMFISFVNFIDRESINWKTVIEQPEDIQSIEPHFDLLCCIRGCTAFLYALITPILPPDRKAPEPIRLLLEAIIDILMCCGSWDEGEEPGGCTWEWLYECQQACHGNTECERACWEECMRML